MSFENIVGNKSLQQLLAHSVSTSNLLHSYLFVGLEGIGKFLFAKEFAKMILNTSDITNQPDFMLIQPEDGKSIKIEQIRYLQEKIAEKPIEANKKVYIINDSDSMTQEAQNCLLKTLEEPPEYAVIILILANENKLLTTIKSRCTKLSFSPLSEEEILEYFSLHSLELPSKTVLKVCDGSIGKALIMQEESGSYEKIDTILEDIVTEDITYIWNHSDILYSTKDKIDHLLEYMNVILLEKLKNTNDLRYAQCVKSVQQAKKRISSNANYDMCIDHLLLKMWEEFHEEYCWS